MERAKKIFKHIVYPPIWVTLSLLVLSAVLLFLVCFFSLFGTPIGFVSYAIWSYTLIVFALGIVRLIKNVISTHISKDGKVAKLHQRCKEDLDFKIKVGVSIGLAINSFYVIFRLVMAIMYSSIWFLTLVFYYLLLGFLRGYLLYSLCRKDRNRTTECRCYSFIAWMMLLLNCTLSGIVILTIKTNSGFSYPGYIIYVSAAYAFYAIISSIINVFKFKKIGNPILSSAKVLNLVAGMVSILALQTAMIARFGGNDESFRIMMNSLIGGIICATVIIVSIYMIIHSRRFKIEVSDDG